jgi:hypothetical protein
MIEYALDCALTTFISMIENDEYMDVNTNILKILSERKYKSNIDLNYWMQIFS